MKAHRRHETKFITGVTTYLHFLDECIHKVQLKLPIISSHVYKWVENKHLFQYKANKVNTALRLICCSCTWEVYFPRNSSPWLQDFASFSSFWFYNWLLTNRGHCYDSFLLIRSIELLIISYKPMCMMSMHFSIIYPSSMVNTKVNHITSNKIWSSDSYFQALCNKLTLHRSWVIATCSLPLQGWFRHPYLLC